MRTYKPEGATHYSKRDGMRGTLWYKRCDGKWWVWWTSAARWALSSHSDRTAALALKPVGGSHVEAR